MNLVVAYGELGLGHKRRASFLAQAAVIRGHMVSEVPVSGGSWNDQIYEDVKSKNPDWIIADVPWEADDYSYLASTPYSICAIEGQGVHNPDIWIGQGFKGQYHAPDYLVMNPELQKYKAHVLPNNKDRWFVYGGGGDLKEVARNFHKVLPDFHANIIWPDNGIQAHNKHTLHTAGMNARDIIFLMSLCNKACVAAGVTIWELLYLGIPTYVFPATQRHDEVPTILANEGYIHKAPVGTTFDNQIREFLERPSVQKRFPIDCKGTERIIKLLEKGSQ